MASSALLVRLCPRGVGWINRVEVTHPFSLSRLPNVRARVDTSAEEAVLKTALADTIDGVEEEDIGDSTCTDARRRLSIGNATGRRRLDGSASATVERVKIEKPRDGVMTASLTPIARRICEP